LSTTRGKTTADIDSRLELFVDDWLIDKMHNLSLKLHSPVKQEVAIRFDASWEGPTSTYVTVMKDEDRYRMYYRGSGHEGTDYSQVACYAESKDGVTWTKPSLGICKFEGRTDNNIIWTEFGAHNFAPFKDSNPDAPKEEQYKAVAGGPLIALASPDGVHWKKIREEPIITKGAFDSQNLAFWDTEQLQYVAYFRGGRQGFRQILRSTSPDFINWTDPEWINLGNMPLEHFYTNATTPYFRAPHIYLAFPKRFMPERKKIKEHSHPGVSDAVFMSSRDGVNWDRRFMEAFIRPGLDPDNWTERNIMPAWGVVPTGSNEISLYYTEHYRHPTCCLRRATLRVDGVVSIHADYDGGEFVTRPVTFLGRDLILNYSTSAVGSVKVEVHDVGGEPTPGHMLKGSDEIYGDEVKHVVEWRDGQNLSHLIGQPIRLKFIMKDADLYSMRFC